MSHGFEHGRSLPLMLALLLLGACSGSRNDSLNTKTIKTADASDALDEAGTEETIDDILSDDAGSEPAALDAGLAMALDAAPDADAAISVETTDTGALTDAQVVIETPRCGNGSTDPGEECDQGASNSNSVPGACRSNCRSAHCGDGVVDPGEACDQGPANSDSEANACRSDCRRARCGDNVIDQGEQCDSGDARSDTASGACRLECRSARCGDGVRDGNEACDDGNTVDADACRNDCRTASCGDGVVDPDEECDDHNDTNGDACQNTCRRPICGDGVRDPSEQCDDANTSDNDGCRSNCQNGCVSAQECSDGPFCNGVERCIDGVCVPAVSGPNLDDGIGCTLDACDETQDRVTHTPMDSLCTTAGASCSAAMSSSQTATCDATRGCVIRTSTQACTARDSVCSSTVSRVPSVTHYAPACNSSGTGCVEGGVEQTPVPCTARSDTSCGPTGTRGAPQVTSYVPACDPNNSRQCLEGGRASVRDCAAGAATCTYDAQQRAVLTLYTPACNAAGTDCLPNGQADAKYCDQEPTYCNAAGQAVDTINSCVGSACSTTTTTCPTAQRWVCKSSTERRLQQGGCAYGVGCTYTDTATAETCTAPQCVTLGSTTASCGGCGLDANNAVTCDAPCRACANGCNRATGQCNIRIGIDPPLGGAGTVGVLNP